MLALRKKMRGVRLRPNLCLIINLSLYLRILQILLMTLMKEEKLFVLDVVNLVTRVNIAKPC